MPIDTFVVLMMENRSFDHYLGWLPGADGHQAGLTVRRQDRAAECRRTGSRPTGRAALSSTPTIRWDGGRVQFNGGKMDGFAARSGGNDEFALGYYAEGDLGFIQDAAKNTTVYDRFFCSLLASTFPNREYMHAAQSYGKLRQRHPVRRELPEPGLPRRRRRSSTRSRERGVDSKYFFNDLPVAALWGVPGLLRSARVEEYYLRAAQGRLPAVSFVDPAFLNEGGGTLRRRAPAWRRPRRPGVHGRRRARVHGVAAVEARRDLRRLRRVGRLLRPRQAPARARPAQQQKLEDDYGQMGLRIPAVALSPYLRRGHVDHGTYGFESILKMIRYRFGLKPLTRRDAYARNIARSFDWESKPRLDPPTCPTRRTSSARTVPADAPTAARPPHRQGRCRRRERPKPHDMETLLTSGYLDRLGFDYKPATAVLHLPQART